MLHKILRNLFLSFLLFGIVGIANADVNLNIVAVNATEEAREKEINFPLPKEISEEDVVDASGLKLEYNVNDERFYAVGKVSMSPKESKTITIRLKDVWEVTPEEVQEIRERINDNFELVKEGEFGEVGKIRKEALEERLQQVVNEQDKSADNIEKRIDNYRIYESEIEKIKKNAISPSFWRTAAPSKDSGTITFIVELENPSDEEDKKVSPKHFLPSEVKPEHIAEAQGFDFRFDPLKGKPYLMKEETLQPSEKKRYTIQITDVWNVDQQEVENVKTRVREIYDLLSNTQYKDNADYLIKSIKSNLESIENSQAQEKDINSHIGAFRLNTKRFDQARDDLDALEELLQAVREELVRSPLRNILQRIKSLKSVADIAEAIFGAKPTKNNAWKIITGIVIFVGIITFIHFAIWGTRSKGIKPEELEDAVTEAAKEEKEEKKE